MAVSEERPARLGNSSGPRRGGPKVGPREVTAVVFLVLFLVFLAENSRKVKIRFLIPEVQAPLYIALLIAALVGAAVALLVQSRRNHRR